MTTNVVKFPLQQRLDWRPLIIGLEGPPGAGKTASALLLAEGIRRVRGGDIRVLDTEGDAPESMSASRSAGTRRSSSASR
jgi:ABC-type lipopolysaccharide export system ATPase subunit